MSHHIDDFLTSFQEMDKVLAEANGVAKTISDEERMIQHETLRLADAAAREFKPWTLPPLPLHAPKWRPGLELSSNGQWYVIFAFNRRGVDAKAIETDPAALQQFRELFPLWLESYATRYNSRLAELRRLSAALNAVSKVMVSHLTS